MACLFNWEALDNLTLCISKTQTYRDITMANTNQAKQRENSIFSVCMYTNDLTRKKKNLNAVSHGASKGKVSQKWNQGYRQILEAGRNIADCFQQRNKPGASIGKACSLNDSCSSTEHAVMAHKSFPSTCSRWLPPQFHYEQKHKWHLGIKAQQAVTGWGVFQWFSRWW